MTADPAEHTWVAFLRGMNLGGRRVTNDALCAAVESCGCQHISTYQASGNVILVDERSEPDLAAAIESGLTSTLGYDVPVFLRSAAAVHEVAAASPFGEDELAASAGKPQVIFLHGPLPSDARAGVEDLVPAGDRLTPVGRELHWLPSAGLSDNTLDLRRLDAVTGGTTIRTLGTVQRLAVKFL